MSARRPSVRLVLPALAVLAAVVVGGTVALRPGPQRATPPTATTIAGSVAVASDAPRFERLEDLALAADLVVTGRVLATERGRWFGSGDTAAAQIQSRLVTLEVTEVLRGDDPGSPSVLIEEEGWLQDGAPVVVDGLSPSAIGQEGIWFLVEGGDPELGAYLVVNAQGRYLAIGGDHLLGAEGDDLLIAELSGLGAEALAARIRS